MTEIRDGLKHLYDKYDKATKRTPAAQVAVQQLSHNDPQVVEATKAKEAKNTPSGGMKRRSSRNTTMIKSP